MTAFQAQTLFLQLLATECHKIGLRSLSRSSRQTHDCVLLDQLASLLSTRHIPRGKSSPQLKFALPCTCTSSMHSNVSPSPPEKKCLQCQGKTPLQNPRPSSGKASVVRTKVTQHIRRRRRSYTQSTMHIQRPNSLPTNKI